MEKTDMSKSQFIDCVAKGNTGYGSCACFAMYIVMADESKVSECSFEKCCCLCEDVSDKKSSSYILGLSDATEENNDFNECQSYHYQYGERRGTHNIGMI